jgi:DNA replication and repair protein RecF
MGEENKNLMTIICQVKELKLNNFRNYQDLSLKLSAGPIIITGHNGLGKTNLLEAISLFTPGRGLRNATLVDMDNIAQGSSWNISATLINHYGEINIVTSKAPDQNRRITSINDKILRKHSELADNFRVIWLTPQMDQLFIGSSSNRRKFLDRIVYNLFTPNHADHIVNYENAMRERNKLLKEYRYDETWLKSIEHMMAKLSVDIAKARVEAGEKLQIVINDSPHNFPKAIVKLEGEVEDRVSDTDLETYIADKLSETRKLDAQMGRTSFGIHRTDLLVFHASKTMPAELCSTGEQKAMLLSLTLAQLRAMEKYNDIIPVILLDEVVAHLDPQKREELFTEIENTKAQAWLTGTEIEFFTGFKAKSILNLKERVVMLEGV